MAAGRGRRLVMEADGGSRGNPGVAGYGALVRDGETGTVLAERAAPLGKRSNNVAEYRGLIAGLESAVAIDPSASVEVRMDSKLVIEQMSGRWKIKHEDMQALALEARDLVRQISAAGGVVSWTWIPRERNKAADKLSNDGMDGRTINRLLTATDSGPNSSGDAEAEIEAEAESESRPAPAPPPGLDAVDEPPESAFTGPGRIWLVRHGSTAMTAQDRLSGRGLSDPALDAQGHREAASAGALVSKLVTTAGRRAPGSTDPSGLGTVRLVTSSLSRARETGAAVGDVLGIRASVDDDWDEQGFGYWDGLTVQQITARWPQAWAGFLDAAADPADQRPPGGESTAELTTRIRAALARTTREPGDVVVVTSRRPILTVLGAALGLPVARLEAIGIDPGSVTALDVSESGAVTVPFVNRTATGA